MGDGSFRRCPIIVPEEIIEDRIIISAVADMNNDGYPDLLIQKNDNTILILLNNKNEDFKEVKEITLPMDLDGLEIGKIFDFDNNGYLDLSLLSRYNGSILYFYDDYKPSSLTMETTVPTTTELGLMDQINTLKLMSIETECPIL